MPGSSPCNSYDDPSSRTSNLGVKEARRAAREVEGTRSAVALSRRRKSGARSETGEAGKNGVLNMVRLAGEGQVTLQARGRARTVRR